MPSPTGADPRTRHLKKLLTSFEPSGSEESAFQNSMIQLLEAGAQVLRRDHYVPGHFTASAFVVSEARDQLLLIHHRKLGRWLQPGGHVEPIDQVVVDAARREALEETGLGEIELAGNGLFDIDIHEIPGFGDSPGHLHFDLRFLFVASRPELRPSSEVKGARWEPLVDLARVTSDESVLRAARKLMAATEARVSS
jgi:8-oxo-dGTP pyrophosphatase MutT (NUDIX family)